jgi:hypothetical protein
MKFVTVVFLSVLLASCGAQVFVDYDSQTDFSSQQTYQLFKEGERNMSPLDEKRINMAIDSLLVLKSWTRTDYCQFYIDFYVEQGAYITPNTIGVGLGSGNSGVAVSGGVGIPIGPRKIEERLTIEVYEAYNNEALVWQGSIDKPRKVDATPSQKETHYIKIVSEILKKFPPQQHVKLNN